MSGKKARFYMKQADLVALVDRLKNSEPGSVEEFRAAFRDKIYGHIMRRTDKNEEIADVILENVYSELLASINTLRKPEAFVSWCNKITEHQIIAFYREKHRREKAEREYFEKHQVMLRSRQEDNSSIAEYIKLLPAKHAVVTRLHVIEGVPVKEIAEMLNVPEGTVKSRLYYGRVKLEKIGQASEKK